MSWFLETARRAGLQRGGKTLRAEEELPEGGTGSRAVSRVKGRVPPDGEAGRELGAQTCWPVECRFLILKSVGSY